ncbi:unnamed protein product [Phytomonas sp. Hart1]|nr:unnamed protein product [Phytomonas sp. Hart1]|eukprot:CCW71753.1 unnamed protein product [Phytomonas sp. isolate Hart1]
MLCQTFRIWAKRTPGYVFWRQSTLIELEHSRRNYLMSERPVPVSEIARRMVRVLKRYEETRDHHERNLLRGEYKYFSGKICDTRGARSSDLIAFLKCCNFFGFWDTAQVERIMQEIRLKRDSIAANELVELFLCLPGLRKQNSDLYHDAAEKLAGLVPELTTQECISVCEACTESAPISLLHNVLLGIKQGVNDLTASQLVNVIDTIGSAPQPIRQNFLQLLEELQTKALAMSNELDCVDIAVLYTALKSHGDCNEHDEKTLLQNYITHTASSCARSLAMMFSATSNSLEMSLLLAQAMEERTLFLATDFTPAELLAVLKIYMRCLGAMSMVVGMHQTHVVKSDVTKPLPVLNSDGGDIPKLLIPEAKLAAQRHAGLRHVLMGLCEQLVVMLEGAASYVSPVEQMTLLEVYQTTLDDIASVTDDSTSLLLAQLPQTRTIMQLLTNKIISKIKQSFSLGELVRLLELGNGLGSHILPDAVVSATIQELLVRHWKLTPDDAFSVANLLGSLKNLRSEHQARINTSLIPKFCNFV